jgi:hypothetical protein
MANTTVVHVRVDEQIVPNAETRAAMAQADEIAESRRARVSNADELFDDLKKASTLQTTISKKPWA